MTTIGPRHRQRQGETRWSLGFLSLFMLLLLLEPSGVVLPGALRSNGSPAVLLALVAFGVVALDYAVPGRPPFGAAGPAVLITVSALELSTWAKGYITPHDADIGAGVTRGLLALIGYTGIALLTMFGMRNQKERSVLLTFTAAALSFDGAVGIIQSTVRRDYRLLLEPPGFVINHTYLQVFRDGRPRATGTADSPIEYAVLMAILVAISIYLIRREHAVIQRYIGIIGLLIGLVGIPSSVSRTGIVGLGGVALAYLIFTRVRNFFSAALTIAVVFALFVVIYPHLAVQLTDLFTQASSDSSVTHRTSDYPIVFAQFHLHPWFGTGLGSNPPDQTGFLDNQWLQAVVEGGIVGVIALAMLFTAALWAAGGAIRHARNELERREGIALLAATVAVLFSSFTFDLYAFNQAKYVFFVLFGLSWAAVAERRAIPEAGRAQEDSLLALRA